MGDFFQRLAERTLNPSAGVQPLIRPFSALETVASDAAPAPHVPDGGLKPFNGKVEDPQSSWVPGVKPERPDVALPAAPKKQRPVSPFVRDQEEKETSAAIGATDASPLKTVRPSFEESPESANRIPMTSIPSSINEAYLPIVTGKISGKEIPPQKRAIIGGLTEQKNAYPRPSELPKIIKSENESLRQEQSPTIRVTIGRVDVRAVFPPEPAKQQIPARRPSPGLSLEEYLRSRNGGKR